MYSFGPGVKHWDLSQPTKGALATCFVKCPAKALWSSKVCGAALHPLSRSWGGRQKQQDCHCKRHACHGIRTRHAAVLLCLLSS
jgi:hypothetical protein